MIDNKKTIEIINFGESTNDNYVYTINDCQNNKRKIKSSVELTKDEVDNLLYYPPYLNTYLRFKKHTPVINEPFFASMVNLSSSQTNFLDIHLTSSIEIYRITILDDKKLIFKQETVKQDYTTDDKNKWDKNRINEEYIVTSTKIVPTENVTCSCGCFNNHPLKEFPWDAKDSNWILGKTINELYTNKTIFFKDIGNNEIYEFVQKNLNKKIQIINKLLKNKKWDHI